MARQSAKGNQMSIIVLRVQRQADGTYSVFDAETGCAVTEGLQQQNYDILVNRMAADRGGDWEEIDADWPDDQGDG